MSGRHRAATSRLVGLRSAALTLAGMLIAALVVASPADAATTVNGQLTLSGVATHKNPTGGTTVGIHPGDRVRFSASLVPSAGLPKALQGLAGGLLGGGASLRVVANFGHLPGGTNHTIITANQKKTFSFPRVGKYPFTYSVQKVTVKQIPILDLLGNVTGHKTKTTYTTINLNGNQLSQAGIKLNAHNQYVGRVVVAKKPPQGGISVQLPKVKVAPSAPVVGQGPTLTVPGVTAPTLHVPSPKLPKVGNKNKKQQHKKHKAAPKSKSSSAGASGPSYTPPGMTIPEEVVPKGNSLGVGYSGGYSGAGGGGGGSVSGLLPDSGSGPGNSGNLLNNSGSSSPAGSGSGSASPGSGSNASPAADATRTVELASDPSSSSSQLPVILAIIAIIALALVAGTYARLFLLKRN